jgi:predicted O-linked N-acetylglucosamine transferase (SPINDLY family)
MDDAEIERALALAKSHHAAGRLADAEAIYRDLLARRPGCAEALHALGLIAAQSGHDDDGIALVRRSIEMSPRDARYRSNLAAVLITLRRFDEAVACAREAAALDSHYADAHHNLGVAHAGAGHTKDAIECYRRALALRPEWVEEWNGLGLALMTIGRADQAADAFRKAIALNPRFVSAQSNLSMALRELGEFDEAIAASRRAIELGPDEPEPHHNLGRLLAELGRVDEAIPLYRKAIALKDEHGVSRSALLLALHSQIDADPRSIFHEHVEWSRAIAEPLAHLIQPHINDRDPDRKLRIGYVSPNFVRHSVTYFMEAPLAHHDRDAFEVTCYADVPRGGGDEVTERFRRLADRWVDLAGASDEELAERVRGDRIGVLIDLAGHTAGNRLRTFAMQPAPVQVTYLGYPDTTGLKTMRWRLTDERADPHAASEAFHTERLWRLPETFLCYTPPPEAPLIAQRDPDRPVTFACFNTFRKVNRAAMELWARVLHAVPGSRLTLKAHGLKSAELRRSIAAAFAQWDIDPARVELLPPVDSVADHLARYHQADVALDTFPYNGTTTTCEALWMGAAVVTMRGTTHASRVGASILSTVGLADLVADEADEYVRIATQLAQDADRRRALRQGMRTRMTESPLMDAAGFTRRLEAAYRQMWREWCRA